MPKTARMTINAGILTVESMTPGEHLDFLPSLMTFSFGEQVIKKIRTFKKGVEGEILIPKGMAWKKKCMLVDVNGKYMTTRGFSSRIARHLLDYGFEIEKVYTSELPGRPSPRVIADEITFGSLLPKDKKMRREQVECLVEMLSREDGAVTMMAMGSGKTHVIAGLVRAHRGSKTVVCVKNRSVVLRLYDGIRELVQGTGVEVGIRISGRAHRDGDCIITTNKGLVSFDDSDVDVLIADECHTFGSDESSTLCARLYNSAKYGLTGTFKRSDGKHLLVEGFFGPICFEYSDEEAEEDGRVVPMDVYMPIIDSGPVPKAGYGKIRQERIGIWENGNRNRIVSEVAEMVPADHQLLIFVRTKAHMDKLLEILGNEYICIHSKMGMDKYQEMLKKFETGEAKRVLATDCIGVGVDPKALRVVIDANWTTSDQTLLQRAGRNRRHADGKEKGILIRPFDAWWETACGKSESARNSYRKKGWNVVKTDKLSDIKFD